MIHGTMKLLWHASLYIGSRNGYMKKSSFSTFFQVDSAYINVFCGVLSLFSKSDVAYC